MRWLLLIYTVPAEPSRKRASIWRELKRLGAPYLRDGVCILPERADTLTALRAVATRVVEFEGEATVVTGARLEPVRSAALIERFQNARSDEYAEITRETERLLEHVGRETEHREFTYAELEELEADLGKLLRWAEQVRARDYFGGGLPDNLQELLHQCEAALGTFLERAAERDETSRQPPRERAPGALA